MELIMRKINGKHYLVSRLVGFAFIERPSHLVNVPYEQLEINHIDGNRINNNAINLEWTTSSENVRHAINNLSRDGMYSIVQYSLNGKFIAKYLNAVEAMKAINKLSGNSHIQECCQGLRQTAYNYIWRYDGDELGELPANSKLKLSILQYNLNGDFVREYSNTAEASRFVGIHATNILRCCNFKQQTTGGFIWRKRYPDKFYDIYHKI